MKDMDLLLDVYIANEWNNDFNCARVLIDESLVKLIFKLHRKAGKGSASEWEYSISVGHTEVDFIEESFKDIEELSAMMGDSEVFKEATDVRIDAIQLHVDKTHFWWSGCFKFSGETWETKMVPIEILPQEFKTSTRPKKTRTLTDQEFQEILAIARSGLEPMTPGSEIPKKISKVQLFQAIKRLLKE